MRIHIFILPWFYFYRRLHGMVYVVSMLIVSKHGYCEIISMKYELDVFCILSRLYAFSYTVFCPIKSRHTSQYILVVESSCFSAGESLYFHIRFRRFRISKGAVRWFHTCPAIYSCKDWIRILWSSTVQKS